MNDSILFDAERAPSTERGSIFKGILQSTYTIQASSIMASGQTVLDLDIKKKHEIANGLLPGVDLDIMASGLNPPHGGSTNSASSETIVVVKQRNNPPNCGSTNYVSSDAMVLIIYCFAVATFLPLHAPFGRYPLLCIKSTNFWRFLLQVL
jgi:hypothetical protein